MFFTTSWSQQIAFPGAEGYGKYTTGGRGGNVIEVTNLNASGTGSLGAAIDASGPRIVVFRVSGTIKGNFTIRNGNITIAGQTAPGDGICIRGNLSTAADNIIIRYIRVRNDPSMNPESDATGGRFQKNIIYDHVSVSWSTDEVFSLYHNSDVTIQWCLITEACAKFINGVNTGHRFGGIWGNDSCTMHHNLIANNDSRNPRWASGSGYNDYRNNVLYNWGYNSSYGGENHQSGDPRFTFTTVNMVANYYKPGPATESGNISYRIVEPGYRDNKDTDYGKWYVAGNHIVGNPTVTANNWNGGVQPSGGMGDTSYVKLDKPWDAMPINQQSPQDAYDSVLVHAGCSFPKRDLVDERVIYDTRTGTALFGNNGIVTTPNDVGGWPVLNSTTPPTDTDHDGMPDAWESSHGLNPNDASDASKYTLDPNYTNVEVYINSIIKTIPNIAATGVSVSPSTANIEPDSTIQLTATFSPNDASNKNIVWRSSNPSVATVNIATGLVTGVSHGTALIQATTQDGSFKDTCVITVQFVNVQGVTLPDSLTIGVAETKQLTETIFPSNSSNKNVSWSSSDTSIAKVDSTGNVTGIKEGNAVIIVSTEDGGFKDSTVVSVVFIPVTSITLPEKLFVREGEKAEINYTISPSNASNKKVSWSSSDTSIAKVDSTGIVSGIKEGNADIIGTTADGDFKDTSVVMVYYSTLPKPLIRLDFNDNGGSNVANNGSVTATFSKTDPPSWSANVPKNGGISSLDFGTTAGNYYVESGSIINQLAGLKAFTVIGWVNNRNSTVGSGGNRIVSWIKNGGNGVDIVYVSDGSLKVGINQWPDNTIAVSSAGEIPTDPNAAASNWKFFTVTYEASSGNLKIYFGNNTTPASLDTSITYNQGAVGTDIGKLAIGHFNSESNRTGRTDRMFRGLIDQIAIYDSVLTSDEVQIAQFQEPLTGIKDEEASALTIPKEYTLKQNYPNPFNPSTRIEFSLPVESHVSLEVFDILGRRVATLIDGNKIAGNYSVEFNASNLSTGVYIYRLNASGKTITKKMLLLK